MPPQNLGYHLTLLGPRGADYAPHITTGPPIFLDDAAPLQSINFDPPWFRFWRRGGNNTCIRVLTGKTGDPYVGKLLDNDCTNAKVFSICEL